MKNHLIIGYLIPVVFFLTSPLSANSQEQKPHVGYGPNAIDRVDENDREALNRSLANFLKAINTNSFDSCYSVDFDYLQSEWNPFLFLDNAQKSGKHGDPWFYKPVVTYVAPLERNTYTVKDCIYGNGPR